MRPSSRVPRESVVVRSSKLKLVVMGASSGGLRALETILGALPAGFSVPIVAVQHRSRESEFVTRRMTRALSIPVHEAEDKDPIETPGLYLAPPGYHLLIEPGRLALSTEEPMSLGRPSIDVLFESAADAYGTGVLGVLLTGSTSDGTRGLLRVREAGGQSIVQDPESAESPEMPATAIANGAADRVVQLAEIARDIVQRTLA